MVDDSDLLSRLQALEAGKIGRPSLEETFNALPPPPPLEQSGWKAFKRRRDEADRLQARADALAEQRRLAEERRLADEEAERIWQANAPRRQAALDAIPEAEAAFAVIGAEYYEAEKRLGELRKAASE